MAGTIAANPRGLFNRSMRGMAVPPVNLVIERGRIRFFAESIGETDAIHTDVEAARALGHPDLVAPPTFFAVIEADAQASQRRRGQPAVPDLIGCDFRYLLHGSEHYNYHIPIYAGDEVVYSTRIVDFYDKKAGAIEFAVLESVIVHEIRGELARATRTLLHRLP